MSGIEFCPKCKGLHFKNAMCIVRKKAVPVLVAKAMTVNTATAVTREPEQEVQTLRPEPAIPKPNLGRPRIHQDRKAYRAAWMKDWRARKKASAEGRE